MGTVRVVLIGGTSHVGKSTVAELVAGRLGLDHLSTDGLARHPGRPWRTPEWEVPQHVAEHYRTLPVEELTASVLAHYTRLWPRIEELVTARTSPADATDPGLVLEGSALWPERVATLTASSLTASSLAAVWLTADESLLRARMHQGSRYERASEDERRLVDAFLARAVRYQELLRQVVDARGLKRVEVRAGQGPEEVADAVLASVNSR